MSVNAALGWLRIHHFFKGTSNQSTINSNLHLHKQIRSCTTYWATFQAHALSCPSKITLAELFFFFFDHKKTPAWKCQNLTTKAKQFMHYNVHFHNCTNQHLLSYGLKANMRETETERDRERGGGETKRETERETEREGETETDRERGGDRQRERQRERKRERGRERERGRKRETEREGGRQRERASHFVGRIAAIFHPKNHEESANPSLNTKKTGNFSFFLKFILKKKRANVIKFYSNTYHH